MEVEKSSGTLAFVDAPYFRKLFSPPLVEGSVGTEWEQARWCTGTVQPELNRGGSRWPWGLTNVSKVLFEATPPAFLKVSMAPKLLLEVTL